MSRLWDKGEPLDRLVLRYTAGEDHSLDDRLVPYDVRATIAHVEMLCEAGYLTDDDLETVRRGLLEVAEEHIEGMWRVSLEDEDCHTALEQRLVAKVGEAGERIHLGRSRNDQVLAALRLLMRDAIDRVAEGAEAVAKALEGLAARQGELELPGYTHLQRAMPSTVGLWALGFASELRDDAAGVRAVRRRVDKNPLGSAAGYGTPGLDLDREATRLRLGFAENHEPVTAVQLSRGKAEAQLLFEITMVMQDLGRLASDLVLFACQEFAFVELPRQWTTGSSIMPQKRNPDVFELVRGRTAQAQSSLLEVLAVVAKLPSGYHRDLQLIKVPLLRGVDVALDGLEIMARGLEGVRFRPESLELDESLHAASEAYRMVREEGLSFREAYRRVAKRFAPPAPPEPSADEEPSAPEAG